MSDSSLVAFDTLPDGEAAMLLETCCGSTAWVNGMVVRRPFGTLGVVLQSADELWWSLAPDDWREAFDHHPRIGERAAAAEQSERAREWSSAEQSAVSSAAEDVRRALVEGNREYERRFGHIYLVSATGKSAEEMLSILWSRLRNDPDAELRVAAAEQAKITRLRLERMFGHQPATGAA
ncbi:MAG TPA: 2-oxo-4-hydroxy-4-carboxy-5-ureidoimidazoline decarboxylase [Gemmatimonadaceae bacterium]|nr:2-oxo-4-hydroxy-4-carboxy-5-ureidoimidazoline decarboxylase [Gemmatimonadaceae bacterium]